MNRTLFYTAALALTLVACSPSGSTPPPIPVPQIGTITTNPGGLELEVLSISPASGTTLTQCPANAPSTPDCKVVVTLRYTNKSKTPFLLWVIPDTDKQNYGFQASEEITSTTGTLTRFFAFDIDGKTPINTLNSIQVYASEVGDVQPRKVYFEGYIKGINFTFKAP